MPINAALNLAIPIRWSDKRDDKGNAVPLVWAYHTPISREIFEANYRVIAATQVELSGKGRIGLRIASLALKDAARLDALEYGLDENAPPALLGELKRLTTVLAPSAAGYDRVPVDAAIANNVIDAEDWLEAESSLVFFTCAYAVAPRSIRDGVGKALASVLKGSTTSLLPTEFAASLPTSTPAETSEAIPPSSVPS
jgi:hypothetical protein